MLIANSFWELAAFLIPFVVIDMAIGSSVFGSLIWFAYLIGLGRATGINPVMLARYENVHSYLNFALFFMMGFAGLLRFIKRTFHEFHV